MARPKKYNKNQLIAIMKTAAFENNSDRLSKKDIDSRPDLPGAMTIIRYFGSWSKALRESGLKEGKQTGRPKKEHLYKIGGKMLDSRKTYNDDYVFFTKQEIYNLHMELGKENICEKVVKPFMSFFKDYLKNNSWIYPPMTSQKELLNLSTKLKNNDYVSNSFLGFKEIKGFFNSIWDSSVGNKLSPVLFFDADEVKWENYIKYRFGLGNSKLYKYNFDNNDVKYNELFDVSFKQIRRSLEVNRCVVSLFKPTLAKNICLKYGTLNGTVLDPCAGFGGRLLGALAAEMKYVACEPNKKTYLELKKMSEILNCGNIYNMPLEEFRSDKTFDLIFTCPPYFKKEIYSREPTQSVERYTTMKEWQNNFLLSLLDCSKFLKKGKYFILVIDDSDYIVDNMSKYNLVLEDKIYLKNTKLHLNKNKVQEQVLIMRKF
jgi:16S rRNA G966 N2-methylase RsmD